MMTIKIVKEDHQKIERIRKKVEKKEEKEEETGEKCSSILYSFIDSNCFLDVR